MLIKKLFLLLFFVSLSACQTLSINIPGPLVEPPETPGEKRLLGDIFGVNAQDLTLSSNAGGRPPDLTQPASANSGAPGVLGDYGFSDRLSGGLMLNVSGIIDAFFFGRLKLQLLGSTTEKRRPGFHMATWGRIGSGSSSASGDQDETLGSGGYPWSASAHDSVVGVGASMGYRFNKYFMTYIGAARDWHRVKSTISQDAAKGDPGGSYKLNLKGQMSSASLGLQYMGKRVRFGVQGVYSEAKFELVQNHYEFTSGLTFGLLLEKAHKKKKRRKKRLPKYIELEDDEECEDDHNYECIDE